jgi:hypothetical protein
MFILVACSNQSPIPADQMPELNIPLQNMNDKFRIWPMEGNGPFKIGTAIDMIVSVSGSEPVVFKPDYGLRIFLYEDNRWLEIDNLVNYEHVDNDSILLFPANGNAWKEGIAAVYPKFNQPKRAAFVRIISIGNVYREGHVTDEKTASFFDVKFIP